MSLSAQLAKIHDDAASEHLLTVAADLMDAQGPGGAVGAPGRHAAHTSHRAVYALFGSMQGLLDALATFGYRDLATRVGKLTPPTTRSPTSSAPE